VSRSQECSTGIMRVELDEAGRPRFEIAERIAWDHIPWSDDLEGLARRADGVCFGMLARRKDLAATHLRFLGSTRSDYLKIFVNLRRRSRRCLG
jgi:fructokinase